MESNVVICEIINILCVLFQVNLKSPAALFEYQQKGNRQKIRSFLDRTCLFKHEQSHNELLFSTWDTVAALCGLRGCLCVITDAQRRRNQANGSRSVLVGRNR